MRLWSRKPQVLGPKGSLLTNRMSELFTYGSVGGVGRKPGPYPAAEPPPRLAGSEPPRELVCVQCGRKRAFGGGRSPGPLGVIARVPDE